MVKRFLWNDKAFKRQKRTWFAADCAVKSIDSPLRLVQIIVWFGANDDTKRVERRSRETKFMESKPWKKGVFILFSCLCFYFVVQWSVKNKEIIWQDFRHPFVHIRRSFPIHRPLVLIHEGPLLTENPCSHKTFFFDNHFHLQIKIAIFVTLWNAK